MDEETVIGIQKMRENMKEHKPRSIYDIMDERDEYKEERDAYKEALEDILRAHTVGRMIEIASRVLHENRKWSI